VEFGYGVEGRMYDIVVDLNSQVVDNLFHKSTRCAL
jgi:hypothetical protein